MTIKEDLATVIANQENMKDTMSRIEIARATDSKRIGSLEVSRGIIKTWITAILTFDLGALGYWKGHH